MLLRTLIVICALVTNESAVSEFNNALRIYNDHCHIACYSQMKHQLPQHFQCLQQTLKIYRMVTLFIVLQ